LYPYLAIFSWKADTNSLIIFLGPGRIVLQKPLKIFQITTLLLLAFASREAVLGQVIRVNVRGGQITDPSGNVWEADGEQLLEQYWERILGLPYDHLEYEQ
jgi:hypothetical protein